MLASGPKCLQVEDLLSEEPPLPFGLYGLLLGLPSPQLGGHLVPVSNTREGSEGCTWKAQVPFEGLL